MRPENIIGHLLGHYRIIRSLGYGGSALVFLALDINLQREVAVKVFQPSEGDTQEFLRRFAREARVLAQLDHPNILPIYDYGEQNGIAYLVVPLMAGGSLKDYLSRQKIVPPTEAVYLIGQVLSALQYAHERGLIHRDIKPGNMLFKVDGTLVLADFGLVKIANADSPAFQPGDAATLTHTIAGTPDYMAPEQALGKVVPASDIYSTGIVLYEMLTGQRPFSGDSYVSTLMKQLHELPRPLQQINPTVPSTLEAVVMRSLAKEPEGRYQYPAAMQVALRQALSTEQTNEGATIAANWLAAGSTPLIGNDAPAIQTARAEQPLKGLAALPITPTQPARIPNTFTAAEPLSTPIPGRPRRSLVRPLLVLLVILFIVGSAASALFALHIFGPYAPFVTPTTIVKQTATITKGGGQGSPTVTIGATQQVVQVTTACPATGIAQAAIMPPMTLGSDQNIVYIVNEGTSAHPTFGTIKRRDVTAALQGNNISVEIQKMPGVYISEGQVSRDGAWVLFSAKVGGQYQLRLVRVDGQYLQTLYCATAGNTIAHVQWSYDLRAIAFDEGSTLYLLNAISGQLQPELLPDPNTSYAPITWLDNSRLIVGPSAGSLVTQYIYLLDTQQGANQQSAHLQKLLQITQNCFNFDTSYDLQSLFVSTCGPGSTAITGPGTGPGQISNQPVSGGTARIVYTSATQAIMVVRAVTPTALLFTVENYNGQNTQSGLWKVNTDGSGVLQLVIDTRHILALCPFSQYSWSNVSRDNTMYALQGYDPITNTYSMDYGSLTGSSPTQFAAISNTQLFLVGWTTM